MSSKETILRERLTFSSKKMLLEIVKILCCDKDGETMFIVEENSKGRKQGIFRTVKILSKGNVYLSGNTQEELFEELKKKLCIRINKRN